MLMFQVNSGVGVFFLTFWENMLFLGMFWMKALAPWCTYFEKHAPTLVVFSGGFLMQHAPTFFSRSDQSRWRRRWSALFAFE